MDYSVVAFESADDILAAYEAGRCDVYTTDQSGLYVQRSNLTEPDAHVVLPEVISKEPLGPFVSHGDDEWFDVVKWSLYCMINAEEMGISSANVGEMVRSNDPGIKRLLGTEGDAGQNLGLSTDWCANIVAQVGNYGESFDRNLGASSTLRVARGMNALWNKGGIQYAPPIR